VQWKDRVKLLLILRTAVEEAEEEAEAEAEA
jgi:hypothetical protein